jgi:cephalosporin-C deacetylase-like acetyl esterase
MPIAVQLSNASPTAVSGITRWEIKSDEGTTVATAKVSAVIPGQGETQVTSSYRPGMPGFYKVTCEFRSGAKEGVKSSMTLGYRPEEIKTTTTNQKDFDEFWTKALENLAAVDPQFQMTRHAEMDTDTHEVYEVEMRSLGEVRVRGWYERPLAAGRFPAMLRVPGYGGNMKPTGSKELMAILSFNIRGHGNSQEDVPGDPKNYWIRGLDQKQDYFYLGAYADCVRAVDFLVSRPEVDSGRIVVTGGSQGGGLSLATAALDPRISLCAPDIPFLCDWVKYFKASHWPEMNAWVEAESDRSWATTLRTLSYFDTLNMADRIRCPVFLGVGLQDEVCPAATIFAVYNRLRGPKEYHVYPTAGHSVGASHHQKRRDWIREHLQKN